MDTYRGVALGVECAWPAADYRPKGHGAVRRRSKIFAGLSVALAMVRLGTARRMHELTGSVRRATS
jgi:hypothetical protein